MDSELRKAAGNGALGAPKKIWLDAWNDPVAGLSAYTSCVHTCNLMGDGDWRLVVADSDKKLKVPVDCLPQAAARSWAHH
jgi:Bardet-Biedl syndrome 1 protein